ncbi:FliM/FliN family flagellar motor switch protein [Aquincola tertiaricarbonis]|uniref:FliM/FliN family flagellar motor switch protein n=1 Tax=Aquincola tertiaricarbonis TaxID=391953 RepID=UPI000697E6BE|nr:FliM/FliN family flagellar motor C-terminal domain-containing protein [Aquincola tertiaricarbonis]
MTASLPTRPAEPPMVLDAGTLGRPVHLLAQFSKQLREDLAELLRLRLNVRYRARFEVSQVAMRRLDTRAHEAGWLSFGADAGEIACAIDRGVLMSVLAYRYGLRTPPAEQPGAEAPRETATEERLAALLGQQFVELLAGRIEAGPGAPLPQRPLPFKPIGRLPPARGCWLLEAQVVEHSHGSQGRISLAIGDGWMNRLWHQLTPLRAKAGEQLEQAAPLPTRLTLTLVARLLQKDIPLGQLADLHVGDVIPISLGTTDVLIDDSRLFTATVAEHQGKLCLTSFADVD